MKNRIISAIVALVIMVLSFASLYVESSDFEYQTYIRVNKDTNKTEEVDTRDLSYEELMEQMATDYFNIKSVNEDEVGFLNIPNIGYYPVVMGEDNQFYLNHNEYKEKASAGITFMNTACGGTFEDIALIHGHKMKSGAMFGALHYYQDEEFFRNNDYISVFDGEYLYLYQPFSVFVYEDGKGDITGETMGKNARKEYMQGILDKSTIKPADGQEFDLSKQVLFLSTCDYTKKNGRLMVASVMVKKIRYDG